MAEQLDTQKRRSAPKLGLAAPAPVAIASDALPPAAALDPIAAGAPSPEPVAATISAESVPAAEPIAAQRSLVDAAFVPFASASALFGGVQESAKSAIEKSASLASEMTAFVRDNVEACATSSRIAIGGVRAISATATDAGKASMARTTSAMKSIATAKSPFEYYRLQSDLAKSTIEGALVEMANFNEAMIKLASDVAAPLSARALATVAKVTDVKPL